jgi:periplasmic protein TonB
MMSFAVHALLLGLAIYVSSRPKADHEKLRAVTFFNPAPPPPPPPPPPAGGGQKKPKTEHKKIEKKPDTVVQTTKQVEKPPDPTPDPSPEGQVGGVVGGVAGGVVGGVVGGTVGGVVGGTVGGTGTQVIPFGAGMVKPEMLQKPDIRWSKEAFAMHIGGVALLKCTINLDGTVSDCKITKGLPYMDQQILEAVKTMRYSPIMYQGHPQRVEMVIPLRIPSPG